MSGRPWVCLLSQPWPGFSGPRRVRSRHFINGVDNPRRKHSAFGRKSPAPFKQSAALDEHLTGTKPVQVQKIVDDPEVFYDAAAKLTDQVRTHEAVPENDRLLRALRSMGHILQADGMVEIRRDAHAERFVSCSRRAGLGAVISSNHYDPDQGIQPSKVRLCAPTRRQPWILPLFWNT